MKMKPGDLVCSSWLPDSSNKNSLCGKNSVRDSPCYHQWHDLNQKVGSTSCDSSSDNWKGYLLSRTWTISQAEHSRQIYWWYCFHLQGNTGRSERCMYTKAIQQNLTKYRQEVREACLQVSERKLTQYLIMQISSRQWNWPTLARCLLWRKRWEYALHDI